MLTFILYFVKLFTIVFPTFSSVGRKWGSCNSALNVNFISVKYKDRQKDINHLIKEKIQYNTILQNTIQYNTVLYNTILYNTIQYDTVQYSTL